MTKLTILGQQGPIWLSFSASEAYLVTNSLVFKYVFYNPDQTRPFESEWKLRIPKNTIPKKLNVFPTWARLEMKEWGTEIRKIKHFLVNKVLTHFWDKAVNYNQ